MCNGAGLSNYSACPLAGSALLDSKVVKHPFNRNTHFTCGSGNGSELIIMVVWWLEVVYGRLAGSLIIKLAPVLWLTRHPTLKNHLPLH